MPYHIAINGTALTKKQRTGVENFTVNLILALSKYDKTNRYTLIAPDKPEIDIGGVRVNIQEVRSKYLWHKIALPRALKKIKPDIYLEPSYMLPAKGNFKSIIVIHDLASIYFPKAYTSRERLMLDSTFKTAERASGVVFLSENTKIDFLKFYKINSPGKVIYQSYDEKLYRRPENIVNPLGDIGRYILNVGRLETRKNIFNLIKAYEILVCKYKISQKLVLVGKPGVGYKEIDKLINALNPKIRDNVIIAGFLEDSKMPHLYAGADLFVYPTLYEGFGIPILESFACGTSVACSNTSSLPEVAGNAASYFDPKKPEDIAEVINNLLSDSSQRDDLIKNSRAQIDKFSWEKCSKEFVEFLDSL
jgi:glycosyltransferase involved in cell wall biosynthesis